MKDDLYKQYFNHSIKEGDTDGDLKPWQIEEMIRSSNSNLDIPETEADPVSHPSHYTDGKIEVIDYIEDKHLGFHLGNAVKYISRAGKKDPNKLIEDLEKARWYLDREIERLKKMDDILPEGSIVCERDDLGKPIVGRYPCNKKKADGYCYGNQKDDI